MPRLCTIPGPHDPVELGPGKPFAVIAGPCTLESRDMAMQIAALLRDTCDSLGLPYVFKASFDKANRSRVASERGPGLVAGVEALRDIRERVGVPVTTDLHAPEQASLVAEAVDLLQIPAFLCRQTDLLVAAGRAASEHGRAVNVKKGQFLAPSEMRGPVGKLAEAGCDNVMCTERGTFFGYNRLVNDFIGLGDLMELDAEGGPPPVCFDVTHSTQTPGTGDQTGGRRDRAALLARAAAAAGVHAIFIECHPDPANAVSDAATQMPLAEMPGLLRSVARAARASDSDSNP